MGLLYIMAKEEGAGKTAICAGIAINLLNAGKKTGYFKPHAKEDDGDISFMKKIPGLKIFDNESSAIKSKDIVLVEASLDEKVGDDGKVIIVEAYGGQTPKPGSVSKKLGDNLLGIIINKVPSSLLKRTKEEATEQYGKRGIKVLGVIPENRVLLAITVGELAECIGGKILNHAEKSGELVENYMLGAMVVGSGLDYFGRKNNKAAVIRQERLDMQLAALETSMSCLVLSGGNQPPAYAVLYKAESRGVPIVTTDTAVNDIVNRIDDTIVKTSLNQEKKLAKLAETVKQNLDMKVFG